MKRFLETQLSEADFQLLVNEIKKMVPKVKMKLIVLSNQGQDQDIEEAKKAGAIGYIIKAQSIPSEVVKKVEKIMSAK